MIAIYRSLKSWAVLASNRASLLLFNSSVSYFTLLIWSCYYLYCRIVFPRCKTERRSHSFSREGVATLPPLPEQPVQSSLMAVNRYLDPFLVDDCTGSVALPRQSHPLLASFIFDCLCHWRKDIEAIFHSYFSCHWISVYRTYPFDSPNATSSFAWHYDEDPPALKKIFIYLDDTTRHTGAFRYFPMSASRLLFRRGFISNSASLRVRSQALIDRNTLPLASWLEGKAGTAFIFDNNIIHRGTHPEHNYRTVIAIEVMPSDRPLTLLNIENSLRLPILSDFPRWPWNNPYFA